MKDRRIEEIPYQYQNTPIPGGGFVTGFVFHNKVKDILYARTDIGGVYRFDFQHRIWKSLMDHVTTIGRWEACPLSIALDDNHPDFLYVVAGDFGGENYLCRSYDRGETFEYFRIPAKIHGNSPGRSTGERLQVDPFCSDILYFGSQSNGLFRSLDRGETWSKCEICPAGGEVEENVAFVWLDPRCSNGKRPCSVMVVSVAGDANGYQGSQIESNYLAGSKVERVETYDSIRGKSLYISKDGGNSFVPLPQQPEPPTVGNYRGFVGQRAAFDGEYLYITMAASIEPRSGWSGYGCDNGGTQYGAILRYQINEDGIVTECSNITPGLSENVMIIPTQDKNNSNSLLYLNNISDQDSNGKPSYVLNNGFGGIAVHPSILGMLISTTQCSKQRADTILCSRDRGVTWTKILEGLEIGNMDFSPVSYMKPEYNGGGNLIHWMSDIKIDPFCPSRAVFNTGTGIFMTENLEDCMSGGTVSWKPVCEGVEETVHLNVYSPPAGEVHLIDIVGDLGGFAFTDVTRQCENSFADEKGNRYITCLNADYRDTDPSKVAVTARGNWTGLTTGGLIWSEDQCKTWRRLADPMGLTPRIDDMISRIHKPNINSGWTALSADGKTLIWCVGEYHNLPMDAVVYTSNLGETWNKVKIYDCDGVLIENSNRTMKILSDRINGDIFYGFGDESLCYLSVDGGRSFHQISVPDQFPKLGMGGMDGRMPVEIRVQPGKSCVVWIATGAEGLWRIVYDSVNMNANFQQVTNPGEAVYRQGMGAPAPDSMTPTLYINGIIDGTYGFYRSFDEGETWQRINKESQMYGDIRSIVGDPRIFGRFYIASGSRGVLWGESISDSSEE